MCRLAKNHYPASICIFLSSFFSVHSQGFDIKQPRKKDNHNRWNSQPHGCGRSTCHASGWNPQSTVVSALSNLCCHLLFICHHGSGSLGWTRHAATISAAESSHNAFSQKDAGNMKKRPSEKTWRKKISVVIKSLRGCFSKWRCQPPLELHL